MFCFPVAVCVLSSYMHVVVYCDNTICANIALLKTITKVLIGICESVQHYIVIYKLLATRSGLLNSDLLHYKGPFSRQAKGRV